MKLNYRFLGEEFALAPLQRTPRLSVSVNDTLVHVHEYAMGTAAQTFLFNNTQNEIFVARDGDDIFIHMNGEVWEVRAINAVEAAGTGSPSNDTVIAPMPGIVVSAPVVAGQEVREGQTLIVIESMKLQTSIIADRDGCIAGVFFAQDEAFDKGAVLMRFAATEDPTTDKVG
ncbi:MAG: biotin/lipoyl-binding protein [Proteobacteria bacterium]|nr:biotin/lipoyl-binding protein [Pseudomonadota bacterium]